MDEMGFDWKDKCERFVSSLPRTNSSSSPPNTYAWKPNQRLTIGETKSKCYKKAKFSESLASTSFHGVYFAVRSKEWCAKFVWVFVILCCCGALSFFCHMFISAFIKQGDEARVYYSSGMAETRTSFPAVTVCNFNKLKRSLLNDTNYKNLTDLDDNLPTPIYHVSRDQENSFPVFKDTQLSTFDETEKTVKRLAEKFRKMVALSSQLNWSALYTVSRNEDFSEIRNAIRPSKDQYRRLGHRPNDLLLSGHFDGLPIQDSEISENIHQEYGRCTDIWRRSKVGQSGEDTMSFTLNLEAGEYIGFLNPSIGAYVSLHHPDLTFSDSTPIQIQPGRSTNIEVSLRQITRAEPCNSNVDYSKQDCQRECLHAYERQHCRCSHAFDESHDKRCSVTNSNHYICTGVVKTLVRSQKLTCDCLEKCKENVYIVRTTHLAWSSASYLEHLKGYLESKGVTYSSEKIKQSIAKVSIRYHWESTEHIAIDAELSLSDLLVKIGGMSALLCGLSVIGLCELIWVAFLGFLRCFRGICQRIGSGKYVKHMQQDTLSSNPRQSDDRVQRNVPGSVPFRRRNSHMIRRSSTRKRLGANRRPSNRPKSRLQQWENVRCPLPIFASTERAFVNCSSEVSSSTSDQRVMPAMQIPEHYTDNTAPPILAREAPRERIVPRLDLTDILSTSDKPSPTNNQRYFAEMDFVDNRRSFRKNSNLRRNSCMDRVFNEIRRRHSNVEENCRPHYRREPDHFHAATIQNRFLAD